MDATLVLLRPHCIRRVVERRAGWEEVARRERRALRCRHRVPRELIERPVDPAAEVLDFRERVRLPTAIERHERLPEPQVDVRRREAPRADGLVLRELLDELTELHATRA